MAVVVAGPWYSKNTGKAIQFARFSSRYNQAAEGRTDRVATQTRLLTMAGDLAGWPLIATAAGATIVFMVTSLRKPTRVANASGNHVGPHVHFSRMAWLGYGSAAFVLLYPTYFDTRFLLPIWPVLAVDVGRRLTGMLADFHVTPRIILGGGLAASVVAACALVACAPTTRTYWNTAALIDDLVLRYQVSNLGNVGNCAAWNVCKTGLINELRDNPGNCFVLHDLTKLAPEQVRQRLARFDAVVVLGRASLPESTFLAAPGLNRSYADITETLKADAAFSLIAPPPCGGLPELSVYVKGRSR
jgi:hypothetical protein